jgi:3-oxoacyl-[acyl-carrier-protein] synthase III
MKNFGNTSSASIPLAMCGSENQVNSLERELSLLIGFGTGFSLSAVIADLRSTIFCGVVNLSER